MAISILCPKCKTKTIADNAAGNVRCACGVLLAIPPSAGKAPAPSAVTTKAPLPVATFADPAKGNPAPQPTATTPLGHAAGERSMAPPKVQPIPTVSPILIERDEYKLCPFCAEKILAVAKKCKHCGETLDPVLRAAEEAQRQTAKRALVIGSFLAGVLLCCAVVFFFSVLVMRNGADESNKTVGDLLQHFKQCGLQGEYKPKLATVIGAIDGGGYSGDEFHVEVYYFEDVAKAKALEKSGLMGKTVHRNGKFIFLAHAGEGKVLPVFKRF